MIIDFQTAKEKMANFSLEAERKRALERVKALGLHCYSNPNPFTNSRNTDVRNTFQRIKNKETDQLLESWR